MVFQKFEKHGESFAPKISIWTNGTLGVGSGVFNTYELTDKLYYVLFYNPELHQVGIRFLASPSETGASKMTVRKSGGILQAKTFFECYKIDYSVSRQYFLAFNDEERLLYFDLDLPFGDGDIPIHPHAMYVSIAIQALEVEKAGAEKTAKEKADLTKALFSIIAHKQYNLKRAIALLKKCLACKDAPDDIGELMLWKELKK